MTRTTGTVKWFSEPRGYGFIQHAGGPDLFVHHTAIDGTGYRTLYEGERVSFDIADGPHGPVAHNVVPLDRDPRPTTRTPAHAFPRGVHATARRASRPGAP